MFNHPDQSAPYDEVLRLFEYAKSLLDLHQEKSVEFWRNIDETALEIWIREDHLDKSSLLNSRAALSDLRQLLSMHLAKMRCAAEWVHRIIVKDNNSHMKPHDNFCPKFSWFYHDHPELIHDCYRHAELPQAIFQLLNKWYRPLPSMNSNGSEQSLPHFVVNATANDVLARFLAERWVAGDRFYVDRDLLKPIIGNVTNERKVLVIAGRKEWQEARTTLVSATSAPVIEQRETSRHLTETFASGLLRLPIARAWDYLEAVRSRIAVLYLFDNYAMFVEYPWYRFGSAHTRLNHNYDIATGKFHGHETQYPVEIDERVDHLQFWFSDCVKQLPDRTIKVLEV